MPKQPSFQFYPGDWLKDPGLRACSMAAKGVWMEVLCLMFECKDRGYLVMNHKPWTLQHTAHALGGSFDENMNCLRELVENGVMKQDKKGRFFNSRMVRDERQRERWRGQKRRQLIENKRSHSTHVSTLPSRPSSSSSSSSSSILREEKEHSVAFESFWAIYPRKVHKPEALRAWGKILGAEAHVLEIVAGVQRWAESEQWQESQRFIPHPARFLNQRQWEDEPAKPGGRNGASGKHAERTRANLEAAKHVLEGPSGVVRDKMRPALPGGSQRS